MGFFSDIFAGGAKGIIDGIAETVDRFVETDDEKQAARIAVEGIVTERLKYLEESARTTVGARMQVIVAELQHGDAYVSHTRPMIARWGLYVVIWNHAIIPTLGGLVKFLLAAWGAEMADTINVSPIDLPTEFWVAWGGIVGTYAIGRSFEKYGKRNALTNAMTGSATPNMLANRLLE